MQKARAYFFRVSYLILSIVLFAQSGTLWAQPEISRLKIQLAQAKTDSQQYIAYENVFRYYEFTHSDSALHYLQQGYAEFTRRGFLKGAASMLIFMGEIHSARGMFELARRNLEEALHIFESLKDLDGIAEANNGLGVIEGRTSHYDAAVRYFLVALKVFEGESNKKGIAGTYLKLGAANELIGNFDKALDDYLKALSIVQNMPVSGNLVTLYNNIGVIYCRKENYKEGEVWFRKSLDLTADPKYAQIRIQPLNNLGNLFKETHKDNEALQFYNQALEIATQEGMPEERTRAMLDIALLKLKSDPEQALRLLLAARDMAREISQKALESECLDGLIGFYKQKGDYKQAFICYDQNTQIQDSLLSVDKAREVANLQALYDLDKSNARVKELDLSMKENAQKRNVIIIVTIAVSFVLLVVILFLWRTRILNARLRRREKELQKANYIKDRLFSIIGHDLRGPMANIPALLGFIRNEENSTEEREFIFNALEENVSASVETLENLLTWGRAQIKGITLNQVAFSAGDIVQNELNLLKLLAGNKNIDIDNNIPSVCPVYADADHFRIIVRNLLSNAIKFTGHDGHIRLNVSPSAAPGFLTFSVSDTGIGIEKERQKQIFESDNESSNGTDNEEGTSLGLMLCKTFVEENGGKIWVESEPGKGSVFYFDLKSRP